MYIVDEERGFDEIAMLAETISCEQFDREKDQGIKDRGSCFMGYGLAAKPSEMHIQNHKAFVQSWIRAIHEKPEALIYAIRDAKTAANYMDWKAGLLTDIEYVNACNSVIDVQPDTQSLTKLTREPEPER